MKVEPALKTRALLPYEKNLSKLPRGKALLPLAQEKRCVRRHALALALFPTPKLVQLRSHEIGEHRLLAIGIGAAALVDAELDPSFGAPVRSKNIAHVQSKDLMLPQPGPEGDAEDHMIAESPDMFAGDFQKQVLLVLGEGLGRAFNAVDVKAHWLAPFGSCYPFMRAVDQKASPKTAVSIKKAAVATEARA